MIRAASAQFRRDYGRVGALLETAPGGEGLANRITEALGSQAFDLELDHGVLQSDYYGGVRLQLFIDGPDTDGERSAIADLGLFDWVARLLGDRRARFIASGLGLQLLPVLGRPAAD